MRYFGGLSIEETAEVLGVSVRTVKRDWTMAKLWLVRELKKGRGRGEGRGAREEGRGMSDERWRRIEEICHDALERLPDDRAAFVRDACAGDAALRVEVESLLANQSRADALGSGLGIRDCWDWTLIGKQIGVYQIVSLLGAGGMGEVYRARDTKLRPRCRDQGTARRVYVRFRSTRTYRARGAHAGQLQSSQHRRLFTGSSKQGRSSTSCWNWSRARTLAERLARWPATHRRGVAVSRARSPTHWMPPTRRASFTAI